MSTPARKRPIKSQTVTFRCEPVLLNRLKASAGENSRTVSQEVNFRLKQSIQGDHQ